MQLTSCCCSYCGGGGVDVASCGIFRIRSIIILYAVNCELAYFFSLGVHYTFNLGCCSFFNVAFLPDQSCSYEVAEKPQSPLPKVAVAKVVTMQLHLPQ